VVTRSVGLMLVAGCAAAAAFGCAGVTYLNGSEAAPPEALQSGRRVRVHLDQPRSKVVGNVVRVSADTLVIVPDEDPRNELALSALNVRRVDISRGQRSRAGRGALVGALGGAVLGTAALVYACSDSCIGAVPLLGLPPGGALIGAGIGAVIGSLIHTERWQRVLWR
jgi:hypothetical protein